MNEELRDVLLTPSERRIIEALKNMKPYEKLKIQVDQNGTPYLVD